MRRCIVCGREIKDGFICDVCKRKIIRGNIITDKKLKLKKCSVCGRYLYRNKWIYLNKSKIKEIILKSVGLRDKVKNLGGELKSDIKDYLKVEKQSEEKENLIILFDLYGSKYLMEIPLIKAICPTCSIKKSQFYKGILQVRNVKERKLLEQIDSIIRSEVKEAESFITKIDDTKDGKDYYITTMRGIKRSASRMKDEFGSSISYHKKLFSRDNLKSKNIYRVTALVKIPDFKLGNIISNKKNILLIRGYRGGLSGINLMTGKKVVIKDVNKVYGGDREHEKLKKLPGYETTIITVKPELGVMHPKTFQRSDVSNQKIFNEFKKLKIGDNVRVVIWDKKTLIIPEFKNKTR